MTALVSQTQVADVCTAGNPGGLRTGGSHWSARTLPGSSTHVANFAHTSIGRSSEATGRDRDNKASFVLERSNGKDAATITASGNELILQIGNQSVRASAIRASSRSDGVTDFALAIPGKINRRYRGVLEVKSISGVLVSVVTMDLETAVASAVQAESAPDTPLEALKAQAVATRSYFVAARGRHHDFDFCDTTHCQFLREPPAPDSNASRATVDTRGLVLAYRDQTVAAMFSRSCGGRTRTPQEIGLPGQGYPYFAVVCEYCLRHPSRWSRRVSQSEAGDLLKRGEPSRLEIDRRLGWDAVPSNNFTARNDEQASFWKGPARDMGSDFVRQERRPWHKRARLS